MLDVRHVQLIAFHSTRYSVRGGIGLVFLVLAMTLGLLTAHLVLTPVEQAAHKVAVQTAGSSAAAMEQVVDEFVVRGTPTLQSWFLGADRIKSSGDIQAESAALRDLDRWTEFLLMDNPALLSAIMLLLLWGWPFIIACGAFDLFSGDIANRGLRYQLLRTDRGSIFLGRFAGMALTFTFVLGLLMSTVVLYIGLRVQIYSWSELAYWGAYGLFAMLVMSMPYMALCAWVSASIASSFGSLTVAMLVIGGVPLLGVLGDSIHDIAGNVLYALPWGFQHYLFHHDATIATLAAAGCMGFALLFCFLGYRRFVTRDL